MEYAPLIITLKTAVVATVVTFFLGIGLALVVVRMRRFQGLADAVITLPLVLPPTVIGFFLLLAFGRRSLIGKFLLQFDVTIVFTWKAAVMAAIVVSLPLMYRTARGAFEQIDPNILGAARTLGHPRGPRALVHARTRRVRRDHHVRRQHPRRHADDEHGRLRGRTGE